MTMTQITPSLASLAIQINQEYALSQEHLKATLSHGRAFLIHRRNTGELLIAAKAQVRHGEWLPWLKDNCPQISDRTARSWMSIAREWESIPAEVEGIRDALAALSPAKTETVAILPRYDWEDSEHFKKCCGYWADYWRINLYLMTALGMPVAEIAERTGKTQDQCLRAMAPEFPDRWQKKPDGHFNLYQTAETPEKLIPYYTQCLKHQAYSCISGDYQRAAIAAERYDNPTAAALLTMQAQVAASKAASVAPEEPFWQVAAEVNDDWVWALWMMLLADFQWAVGTVEQSDVDKVGGYDPIFYVLEAMESVKSATASHHQELLNV